MLLLLYYYLTKYILISKNKNVQVFLKNRGFLKDNGLINKS